MERTASARLVQSAIDGNAKAFEDLIDPLVGPAYQLAVSMLGHRNEAEDAVQESVVRAWQKLSQFRPGAGAFECWFLGIVANQCRSLRRARWWSVLKVSTIDRVAPSPEDEVARNSDLARGIQNLNYSDRLAIFLYFYLDLRIEDVARILRVSANGAKSRIYRAARELRPGLQIQEVFTNEATNS